MLMRKGAAGRLLEQPGQEPAVGEPQQEAGSEPERQHRLSCLPAPANTLTTTELPIRLTVQEGPGRPERRRRCAARPFS